MRGNTPNIVLDRLRPLSPIPIVSAIDATCLAAQQRGARKLGLLGTVFTMSNSFFKTPFEDLGMRITVPPHPQIERIQAKIEAELEHGIVKEATRQEFVAIIEQLQQSESIDHVVLACTELPIILGDHNSPVPCLDTVDIHVQALLNPITNA